VHRPIGHSQSNDCEASTVKLSHPSRHGHSHKLVTTATLQCTTTHSSLSQPSRTFGHGCSTIPSLLGCLELGAMIASQPSGGLSLPLSHFHPSPTSAFSTFLSHHQHTSTSCSDRNCCSPTIPPLISSFSDFLLLLRLACLCDPFSFDSICGN